MHAPDEWCLVKINGVDPHYRIFGSWRGGYLSGDSWRMNSGITKVEKDGEYYLFHGSSGSIYKCHEKGYGIHSSYNVGVLLNYEKELKENFIIIKELPENILEMDWLI